MNLKSRLNKIEQEAAMSELSNEMYTAYQVNYGAGDPDQFRVRLQGQDDERIMSRAVVAQLPGRVIWVEYVSDWRGAQF
jgi:hypothetical protein